MAAVAPASPASAAGEAREARRAEVPPVERKPTGPPLPASPFALPGGVTAPTDIDSFTRARSLFLLAKKALEAGQRHYVLDGCVTDHVQSLQAISRLYKHLATFESDAKRQQAMSTRRIALLDPVSREINAEAYLVLVKELTFELGGISQDMLEMKLMRIEEKILLAENESQLYQPSVAERKKCLDYGVGVKCLFPFVYLRCCRHRLASVTHFWHGFASSLHAANCLALTLSPPNQCSACLRGFRVPLLTHARRKTTLADQSDRIVRAVPRIV